MIAYVEKLIDSVLFEVLVDLLDAVKVLTVDAQLLHLHGDSLQLHLLARWLFCGCTHFSSN